MIKTVNRLQKCVILSAIVLVAISLTWILLHTTFHQDNSDKVTLDDINQRNSKVVESVKNHSVDILVGDPRRILPIKNIGQITMATIPVKNCTTPKDAQANNNTQLDLEQHSFVYLLSLDQSSDKCNLDQIIVAYGKPNESVLIAGSLDEPQEFLLFYDKGISKPKQKPLNPKKITNTVLPIAADQLPNTTCPDSTTTLNIVAHEDDDLLFLSPDLIKNIQGGRCVRTVFLTAGDAGQGELYWQSRERGSEAAYAAMLGTTDTVWVQRTVKLANHQFIIVANPKVNHKVSLIFMRLPDGKPNGFGFKAANNESLERLESSKIKQMHSVDKQSIYSSSELIRALDTLIQIYQPTEILSQTPYNASKVYPDHSDHMAAGRYAKEANQEYAKQQGSIPIKFYTGYPISAMSENVSGELLKKKTEVFLAYAKFDGAVCQTERSCERSSSIHLWLKRQYSAP